EQVALKLDLDVLRLCPGQLGVHDVLVVATPNLHRRSAIHAFEAEEGRREPRFEAHQIVERIPQSEHGSSLLSRSLRPGSRARPITSAKDVRGDRRRSHLYPR